MTLTPDSIAAELGKLKKKIPNPEIEAAHLYELTTRSEVKSILVGYEFEKILGIGGSGAVFQIRETRSNAARALKLSRKSAAQEPDPENPVRVDLEIEALSLVNHQNITRFFGGIILADNHYCLITELVDHPLELDDWVRAELEKCEAGTSTDKIHSLLLQLSEKVCDAARALNYMHSQLGLYHMDIKPANILVSKDGTTFITDLGFARCRKNYSDSDTVPVGFTFSYAHPELFTKRKFRVPSSVAKARNQIPAVDLNSKFDLYSYGRSLLHLLSLFRERFGDRVSSDYCFLYLHLLATLCLGKENKRLATRDPHFEDEVALGFTDNLINVFSFDGFNKVVERLERLSGRGAIEYVVPELNPWSEKVVNNGVSYLNLTPRIESIVNHPSLRRLRSVSQLGLVAEVYPGATHTRYAHTLGVTGTVCHCVTALYHDPENPIFRLLVEKEDIESLVIASLVHDIGQSDYGHELEELDHEIFSHVLVGGSILNDGEIVDDKGRTLVQIIQGKAPDEWGIDIRLVTSILDGQSPRFAVFKDLLDGPLDADKIDYLQRDGKNCNVTYPRGLDFARLVRSITVLPVHSKDGAAVARLRLGVKEKGVASTEVVLLARQQMYRAVYLHHTVRCLKSMLLTACASANAALQAEFKKGKGQSLFDKSEFRKLFASHLLGRTEVRETELGGAKLFSKALKKQNDAHQDWYHAGTSIDRAVTFFAPYLDMRHQGLMRDFLNRKVYKRLVEKTFAVLSEDRAEKLRAALIWQRRHETAEAVVRSLIEAVSKTLQNRDAQAQSMNEVPDIVDSLRMIASEAVPIIFDIPLRSLSPGGSAPPVLSDIGRKRGEFAAEDSYLGIGHIWREGARKLMEEISACRVFCEPRFHAIVVAVLSHDGINQAVSESLPGWSSD